MVADDSCSASTHSSDPQLSLTAIDYYQLSFTLNLFKFCLAFDNSFSRCNISTTVDDSRSESSIVDYHALFDHGLIITYADTKMLIFSAFCWLNLQPNVFISTFLSALCSFCSCFNEKHEMKFET